MRPLAFVLAVATLAACAAPRAAREPLASLRQAVDAETGRVHAAARDDGSAAALRASDAMTALFRVEGAQRPAAQALGVLAASDRILLARELSPRAAALVVEGPFVDVFGVFPPAFADDEGAVVREGRWLACLATAAAVARHAVPDDVHDERARAWLAWSGVLEGVRDRLRALAGALPADVALRDETRAAAEKLEHAARDARSAALTRR